MLNRKIVRSPAFVQKRYRPAVRAIPSFAWACGPPMGMKIGSSRRLYDQMGGIEVYLSEISREERSCG